MASTHSFDTDAPHHQPSYLIRGLRNAYTTIFNIFNPLPTRYPHEPANFTPLYVLLWFLLFTYHFSFSGRPVGPSTPLYPHLEHGHTLQTPPQICKIIPHLHNSYYSPHRSGWYIPTPAQNLKYTTFVNVMDCTSVERAEKVIVTLCEEFWTRTELVPWWVKVWRWMREGKPDEAVVWSSVAVGVVKAVEMWYFRKEKGVRRREEMEKKMA